MHDINQAVAALAFIADALFDAVRRGHVASTVTARYPLADAARAHADLEGRKTTGALVLIP